MNGLATLLSCGGQQQEDEVLYFESSEGPSDGPITYEADANTLITSADRPAESEWPVGYSPQCCWGGCEGSCEDTDSWCSQSPSICADCTSNVGDMMPEYHMCPGEVEEAVSYYNMPINSVVRVAESEWPTGYSPQCCWGGCDGGCQETDDWCSLSPTNCGHCSSDDAPATYRWCPASVADDDDNDDGDASTSKMQTTQKATTTKLTTMTPSGVYETNQLTLITSAERPDDSEWPAQHSPQCCWGGCDGSCEHTYSWCSQSPTACSECNTQGDGTTLMAEYHMCPGGRDVDDESTLFIPSGMEFRCCWKLFAHDNSASCENCDSSWCSESWEQCGLCAGEMTLCTGGEVVQTLNVGDVIPTGDDVPQGKQWQCCWDAQCGDHTCNAPGSWCGETTENCDQCAGIVSLCDIPPFPTLAPSESEADVQAPEGTEWTCCMDEHCGNCYHPRNWCSVSNSNCQQCNADMYACPSDDRRLVHEGALSAADSISVLLPVLALLALWG